MCFVLISDVTVETSFNPSIAPIDGWSSDYTREFVAALKTLNQQSQEQTFAAFRDLGASEAVLRNLIVVEFGDDASIFDVLVPASVNSGGNPVKYIRY